jgi:hypothetical protein
MTTRSPTFSNVNAAVVCTAWKPFERNTLKGFADLWLRAVRLNIRNCALHEKNGRRWVQLPAKPQLDKDRNLVRGEDGKIRYAKVIEFDSREVADRFNAAALKAIEDFAFKADFSGDPAP